ncbi:hypothetical protein C8R47DRAFT_220877 [Mycena vitilis]|nr:hypothetical protein C8R47DRAFT_220877 [Mycena vitilis]
MPNPVGRLCATNSLDMILDFLLTIVSVIFNFAGPFFLKQILDSIEQARANAARQRHRVCIYALLMLLCAIVKTQDDLHHLWCSRSASTRIRVQLEAKILLLARRCRQGAHRCRNTNNNLPARTKASKASERKADDPKAGADTGKIVNLMAATMASRACRRLWSAFAGFGVLIVGWPLNSYVARRRVRMHKGELKASDGHLSVVTELIGAAKFIKFFGGEEY